MTAPATSSSCWSDDASSVQLLIASPSPSSPQQKRHWRQQIVPTAPFLRNDNDDDDDADGLLRSVSDNLCHVEYCPCPVAAEGGKSGIGGGGLLKIVSSDDTRTVLDVIDVDDVIGASIEVHWNDATAANDDATAGISSSSSPRSTADDPRALPRAGAGPKPSSPPPQPGETLVDRQAHATLHIYCYPKTEVKRSPSFFQRFLGLMSSSPLPPQNSPPQPRAAAHRSLVLAPAEDLGGAQALVRSIRTAARYHPHQGQGNESIIDSGNIHVLRRERYLVLVNPVSGKGQAPKEAREVVVPMLEQAGIDHVVVETRYAGHAAEIVREKVIESNTREHSDTDAVTAILVVGGDGVYHECVNTLASHSHRRKEEDDDEIVPWLRQIKLGMVPCGTGSGLAASVAHASEEDCNVISCCFLACKGHVASADTSLYTTLTNTYTSFLTFSWGLVADVDLESECIRWLGTARLDLWAVLRIIFLRTYRGRLSYTTTTLTTLSVKSLLPPLIMPTLEDPVPSDWQVVDDEFILFWASHVTHASVGFFHSPHSWVGDGTFQIMIVRRPMSRFQMVRILLSIDAGSHVDLNGVEFVRCTAFRLEPTGSYNVIDGEQVEPGTVQAHVIPKSMRVFCHPRQQQS